MNNETILSKVSDLKPSSYNPRTISEKSAEGLSKSIASFGNISGIVFNVRTGNLVAGHQRVTQIKSLFGDCPIENGSIVTKTGERFSVRFVNWDLRKEKAANVAANASTITGEFNDSISDLLASIQTDSPEMYSDFNFGDIKYDSPGASVVEVETPPVPAKPKTKVGDLFELGGHRLLCGDSEKKKDVARLLGKDRNSIQLLLTDPPYGIGYGGSMKIGQAKHGWTQHKGGWDEKRPSKDAILAHCAVAIEGSIIWGGNYFTDILKPSMGWLVWDKGQREFSLADGELAWTSFNKALRVKTISRGAAMQDGKEHVTQKPIALFAWCIECADRNSKKEIKNIFDPYCGSGTSIIAAEQLDRFCFAIERDPGYCDVIINRWQDMTGEKAKRVKSC